MSQEGDDDAQLRDVVEAYIAAEKEWPKEDYSVRRDRTEGDLVVFVVVHKDDTVNPIPGDGKSVEVEVDPEKLEVVRELAFQ